MKTLRNLFIYLWLASITILEIIIIIGAGIAQYVQQLATG
jgi:hypothetical protein